MSDGIALNRSDHLREHDGYEELLSSIRREFEKNVRNGEEPLFRTDATRLYEVFLQNLPEEARQHYHCSTCRHFVNRFGGLVRIDEKTGVQEPVMWSLEVPDFFENAVNAVRKRVKEATVKGVFFPAKKTLGTPVTGFWTHMSVELPDEMIDPQRPAASQRMAWKAEEFRLLCSAVQQYKLKTVETAVNLLRSDALYRSERVLGVGEWFLEVLRSVQSGRNTHNILWRRAATAPIGFCHVSTSMIGTLLDDIEAGYSLDVVSRKFSDKMHPLHYQRPQAAPAAGNVEQAEKIVERLGIQNSLKRRFARLEELETIWTPVPAKAKRTGGIFSGLATKERSAEKTLTPAVTMTWEKFQRTVLPAAKKIEFLVTGKRDNFSAIVTAEDSSAPPIMQWDSEQCRCPFNWYVYHNGSEPKSWGLPAGYVEVSAVVLQPTLWPSVWRPGFERFGKSVFFILKGAKDHRYQTSGIALFPEVLRSELREVRATIEAFSKREVLGGYEESSACGIRLEGHANWSARFRVLTDVGATIYELDRWD